MNKLIVLALHCRMETLIPNLIHGYTGSALLVTAHMGGRRLITRSTCIHTSLVFNDVILRTLTGRTRVDVIEDKAVLAQHILVCQSRVEVSLLLHNSILSLSPTLDVSKFGVVGDTGSGHHAHLRVTLRHPICLSFATKLLLELLLIVLLDNGRGCRLLK